MGNLKKWKRYAFSNSWEPQLKLNDYNSAFILSSKSGQYGIIKVTVVWANLMNIMFLTYQKKN